MRHKHKGRKLGTDHGHTKAMKVSLVQALFLNDRIKTTETRAKEIRGNVDKIVTWAKKGDLHSRRLAISALGNDSELAREIFEKVAQGMFEGRNGGYTRIMKLGPRKGDGARMVIMELVNETCVPKAERKAAKTTSKKKTTAKKATAKKSASKEAVKEAEKEVKAEEKQNDADRENMIERIHDSIEAAEEEGAIEVREAGERQLAEEEAEAAKEDAEAAAKNDETVEPAKEDLKEAAAEALEKKEEAGKSDKAPSENKAKAEEKEEIREEEFKSEEAAAENRKAEDNAPNSADMPESEEHAR